MQLQFIIKTQGQAQSHSDWIWKGNSIHGDITLVLYGWESAESYMKIGSRDHKHHIAEMYFWNAYWQPLTIMISVIHLQSFSEHSLTFKPCIISEKILPFLQCRKQGLELPTGTKRLLNLERSCLFIAYSKPLIEIKGLLLMSSF